jgi:L-serine/L-threonine ammonia-lyase
MLHVDTPLLQSHRLSQLTDKTVWLKLEALQPTGSFKLRGIGAACEEYKRQGKTRFVSSSGGNAGLAAAYAGRILGVPVHSPLVVVCGGVTATWEKIKEWKATATCA